VPISLFDEDSSAIAGVKTEEIEDKIDIDDYFDPFSPSVQEGAETKR